MPFNRRVGTQHDGRLPGDRKRFERALNRDRAPPKRCVHHPQGGEARQARFEYHFRFQSCKLRPQAIAKASPEGQMRPGAWSGKAGNIKTVRIGIALWIAIGCPKRRKHELAFVQMFLPQGDILSYSPAKELHRSFIAGGFFNGGSGQRTILHELRPLVRAAQQRTHQTPDQGGGSARACENEIDADRGNLFIAQLAVLLVMRLDDGINEGGSWRASPNCYAFQKVDPERLQHLRSSLVYFWLRERVGRHR